jgi:hypothetical protein
MKRLQPAPKRHRTIIFNFYIRHEIDSTHRMFTRKKPAYLATRPIKIVYLFYLLQNFERFYVNQMDSVRFICNKPCIPLVKPFEFVVYFNIYRSNIFCSIFKFLKQSKLTSDLYFYFLQKQNDLLEFALDFDGISIEIDLVGNSVARIVARCNDNNVVANTELIDLHMNGQVTRESFNVTVSSTESSETENTVPPDGPYLNLIHDIKTGEREDDTLEQVVPMLDEHVSDSDDITDIIKIILDKNHDEPLATKQVNTVNFATEPVKILTESEKMKDCFLAPQEPPRMAPSSKQSRPPKRRKFMRVGLSKRQRISTHLHEQPNHSKTIF